MNIFVCSTFYHVYLSLLLQYQEENMGNCIFVLTSHDKEMKKYFPIIQKKLQSLPCTEIVYIRNRNKYMDDLFIEKIKDKMFLRGKFKFNTLENYYLFGWNQHYLYRTNLPFFYNAKNVFLVEESANAFLIPRPKLLKSTIMKVYNMNASFYKKNKVKRIITQNSKKHQYMNHEKFVDFSYDHLLNKISIADKKNILEIFIDDKMEKEISFQMALNTKGKNIIILTQPLSEDGFETEAKKIKYYEEIISDHREYCIYLKPHPRDKTNYNFKNVIQLNKMFPSELLKLFEFNFEKAIGVCTSAVYQIEANEKVNIIEDYFETK